MAPKDKKARIDLKVPKGTKDWEGKDMVIRDKIFSNITTVFKRHGGVTIDTPYTPPTHHHHSMVPSLTPTQCL